MGGEDVLDALEKLPLKPGTERPAKPVRITEVVIFQDPFEAYKTRLAKKLAKRAEAEDPSKPNNSAEKKKGDDINWFGVKVGTGNAAFGVGASGGVGKYLNSKRPLDSVRSPAVPDGGPDAKKRKTIGFGEFEGW